jgi:hypothetical protein
LCTKVCFFEALKFNKTLERLVIKKRCRSRGNMGVDTDFASGKSFAKDI